MDIDKLEAGRELDALVAEGVMGIPLFPTWDDGMMLDDLPDYSTSISAAWEVVERSSMCEIEYKWFTPDHIGGQHHVDIEFNGPCGQATASTVPLAICRAALKAVTNTT